MKRTALAVLLFSIFTPNIVPLLRLNEINSLDDNRKAWLRLGGGMAFLAAPDVALANNVAPFFQALGHDFSRRGCSAQGAGAGFGRSVGAALRPFGAAHGGGLEHFEQRQSHVARSARLESTGQRKSLVG